MEASRAATGSSLQQEKDHTKLNQIIQVRSGWLRKCERITE